MVLALTTQSGVAGQRSETIATSGEPFPMVAADVVATGTLTALARLNANNNSQQVVATGSVFLTLTNWTETQDNANAFDPVTGLFTAPADGTYQVSACIVATSGTAAFNLAILVNNVAKLQPGVNAGGICLVSGGVQMAKNDVLRVGMTQFSGGNITLFFNGAATGENYLTIAQQP